MLMLFADRVLRLGEYNSTHNQARSYIGTRGGGQLSPRWILCPLPKRPTCNFFYTLIFHHQCH